MMTRFRAPRTVHVLVALFLAGAHVGCSPASDPAGTRTDVPRTVSTHTVAVTDQPDGFEIGGAVQARTTAALTSRIVAPVLEVRVAPGDRVLMGDVVVRLDSRDLVAAARRAQASADAAERGVDAAMADEKAAQAALRLARATHGRIAALADKRSATPHELDEAAAALAAAEARGATAAARLLEATSALESARAATEAANATEAFTRITAPFDGVITEKQVETGNMAMPGTPLVVLEDTRSFRLDLRLDESRARDLTTGVTVPVVIDSAPASDATLDGTVSELARAFDSGTHTVLAKVVLPARPWLRAGMFGRARFSGRSRPTLTVPPEAVVRRGQVTTVFTVEQDIARVRLVNVTGGQVLSGLVAGDVVIVNPPAGLVDGQRVRPGGR